MMVRRVQGSEVPALILAIGKQLPKLDCWAEVRPSFLAERWTALDRAGTGYTLALERDGKPVGFLLGMFIEDMLTGEPQAIEYLWAALPGVNGLPLLRNFELAARERKCRRVLIGCSKYGRQSLGRMRTLYARLGFSPHAEAFAKPLTYG